MNKPNIRKTVVPILMGAGTHRILMAILSAALSVPASAQQSKIIRLEVVKEDGQTAGQAIATVRGSAKKQGQVVEQEKSGRLASNAFQAWSIMGGRGALLLLSPEKPGGQYRLRYYEVDSGKGRLLGVVPFNQASMIEADFPNGWSFTLAGVDVTTQEATVIAGDVNAIHAQFRGAAEPRYEGESLHFNTAGVPKSVSVATIMGWNVQRRIYSPQEQPGQGPYLQFLPTGQSIVTGADGKSDRGHWLIDGDVFRVTQADGKQLSWPISSLHEVQGIPAEAPLTVRLVQPLSSYTARPGMVIKAVLISPGVHEGLVLLPQGTEFTGTIIEARAVRLGIRRETARLTLHFDSVKLRDGQVLPIDARLLRVENSRESVTTQGTIQGIRSTGTIGHQAENYLNSVAQIDPIAYIFTTTSGPAVLGFAESEILYNAGTELDLAFNKPLITSRAYPPAAPSLQFSPEQKAAFEALLESLPFRTKTEVGGQPSDITNLVFLGSPDGLRRMMEAAGWTSTDSLTAAATFQTIKTLAGNQTYTQAPMSTLLLDNRKPLFTMQKTTNTFASRHHLRIFDTGKTFEGQPVLTASSTQDIGIAFSYKQKTFIHVIDQYLDNERSKIANDLEFTGCVKGIGLVPRPWVPSDAYNATGDRLRTDGSAAVLELGECSHPIATAPGTADRPGTFVRAERNTMLTIKDTLYRGNLIYSGVSGGMKLHRFLATRGELRADTGNWQMNDASGTEYRTVGTSNQSSERRIDLTDTLSTDSQREIAEGSQALVKAHKWDPPHYEIALNLGYSNYRNNIIESAVIEVGRPGASLPQYAIGLADGVFDGWAAGVSLTLNTWNWVSNEFSYMRQQTKYDLASITVPVAEGSEIAVDTQTVGFVTRRVAYNTVVNLRPRKSRWRPYVAAGPAFQLLALSDAPLKRPAGIFRLGAANIGLIKAAFDFGRTPALDGGGVFQFGVQYGAGIKFRVTPRFTIRGDYGETWSPAPKIIRRSYENFVPSDIDGFYTTTVTNPEPSPRFIQRRFTAGFAFTF